MIFSLLFFLILSFTPAQSACSGDVSGASYDSVSFDSSAQTDPYAFWFGDNGSKMYISSFSGIVYQYTLSTAYDISSASYASKNKNVSAQESLPFSVAFNADGSKMYIGGPTTTKVFEYALSTNWDVSTASYSSSDFTTGFNTYGIQFNNDGSKMYLLNGSPDWIRQYSLSPNYDVSTASYDSVELDFTPQEASPLGAKFNSDGTILLVSGDDNDGIIQFNCSTGWDLSTCSYVATYSAASELASAYGVQMNEDLSKFVLSSGSTYLYQYSSGINCGEASSESAWSAFSLLF